MVKKATFSKGEGLKTYASVGYSIVSIDKNGIIRKNYNRFE